MTKTLSYVFDPLCGWCYGAIETVSVLSGNPAVQLHLMPSGLFSGPGARPMDDAFAAFAWSNDQRIERLTGQAFSERYRDQVLADRRQMFDSGPASIALTAVALTAPERELEALAALIPRPLPIGNPYSEYVLASVLVRLGEFEEAGRYAAGSYSRTPSTMSAVIVAQCAAALDDDELAVRWLRAGFEIGTNLAGLADAIDRRVEFAHLRKQPAVVQLRHELASAT